jgi:hypothetical protein
MEDREMETVAAAAILSGLMENCPKLKAVLAQSLNDPKQIEELLKPWFKEALSLVRRTANEKG